MSPEWIVMGVGCLIAVMTLVKLMLRRQEQLRGLLRTHVDGQMEWSRKKARAALMARRAAKKKEKDEDLSQLTQMIQEAPAEPAASDKPAFEEDGVTLF